MAEYSKTLRTRASEQLRWQEQQRRDGNPEQVIDGLRTPDLELPDERQQEELPLPSAEKVKPPARKDNLLRAPTRSGMRQRRKSPVTVQEWVASLPLPHLLQQRQEDEDLEQMEQQEQSEHDQR